MSIPQSAFFIESQLNGRVLDVAGGSNDNSAEIVTWTKKDSDNENQLWVYRDGYFANVKSGKVLDIKGNKVENNSHIIQYEAQEVSEEHKNQTWTIDQQGAIHTFANDRFVLDIKGAEDKDGAHVILYERKHGSVASNQQWRLVAA
ncbi:ricin B lectin domain-containing protein [Sporodiniella umbellata]|nr:ricin B lectin domain-containing protein [Sporodiniella umbellata]